ncbi:ArsR family transcriptional regulator [Lutibacter profundi]|uniref:ArsR family transcriptional regulator n=1 Tax=Lutibacter profundi TaxID=1622118 RepID=A0A0X8G6R2_9FLAO|nr:metalloregulator ArsR/SmtB family transcription factor [Lutibacter profundi]AMC11102.1 ArsR family transcriptional regulator [Lutibacter profundi]
MGITKFEKFNEEQNKISQAAKAFAHPARIAILQQLFKLNTCVCGDLALEIGLAQSTTSQHLKELKNVGLIKGTIEGTSVCYCIDEKVWEEFKQLFISFFNEYNNSKIQCC